jgi:hypothetical protein
MSDVGDQSVRVTFNSMSITKRTILDIIRLMAYRKQMDQFKVKHGYQKLKDLNKKNMELDGIGLDQADYKNIKKDLKKMGVDFAIHKRKGQNKIDLYFASRDVKQISNILKKYTEEKLEPKESKKEIEMKEQVATKKTPEQENFNEITINEVLVLDTNANEHYTKIPFHKEYINYDTANTTWIDEGKTLHVKIDPNKDYLILDSNKNQIKTIKGKDIHNYYDDAKKRSIEAKIKKSKKKAKKYNKNRQKTKSKVHTKQQEISR